MANSAFSKSTIVTPVSLANGGTGASLSDPNADRIAFWDDSAGAVTWLTAGTGLTITDTTIAASGGGTVDNSVVSGRLTLQSGQPVMIGNVEGASAETLYYTPYKGNTIALYYNSAWTLYSTAEISMSLSGKTVSKNHDIWAYYTGSAVALESTVWTDDTNRATALDTQDGVLIKSGDATRRYLGTIRMTGTANRSIWLVNGNGGETAKLFVYNQYNRVRINFSCPYTTSSWTLTSASWRELNASSVVRAELLCGYNRYGDGISLHAGLRCTTTSSRIALTIYRNAVNNLNYCTEGYSFSTSVSGMSGQNQLLSATANIPPEGVVTGYSYYCPMEIGGTGGTGYGGLVTASGGQPTGIWGSVFM